MNINKTVASNPYQKDMKVDKAEIKQKVEEIQSKNESKVDRIKREIAEGTYKVDIQATAESIAKDLL